MFQSQTRRLLPRNFVPLPAAIGVQIVSIADATLASPQLRTKEGRELSGKVSIADATLASPQPSVTDGDLGDDLSFNRRRDACFPATCGGVGEEATSAVSIADATLASPQHRKTAKKEKLRERFNRRRDACFPATLRNCMKAMGPKMFQSQTRRLLPRNPHNDGKAQVEQQRVSIADATLASPQHHVTNHVAPVGIMFQSQTRRLLPRNERLQCQHAAP